MILTSFAVLLPVFFVMGLGYWAGRTKRFDADQVQGINDLVLTYALPALMFVATVNTTRSEILADVPFMVAILAATLGLFVVVVLVSTLPLHHSLGEAALQGMVITFPSVAFFGIPIFKGLFGESSLFSIAVSDVLASVTLQPLTVVMLEIHTQRHAGSEAGEFGTLIWKGLVNSFKKPMVWAPLLGGVFVLFDIDPPAEIDKMLALIGSTTGGASIFLAGMIIAAYNIKLDREVLVNVFAKMVLQPALMFALVTVLAVAPPLRNEAILLCAIPATAVTALLAARYKVYEVQSASSVALDVFVMIVSYPLILYLIGAA